MQPPYRLSTPIQVRFRDTDAMGHVNNAVYLTYLEIARTDYWTRVFGLESYNHVDFIVARAEVDFLAPARVEDALHVHIRVSEIGNKSFAFAYEIERDGDATTILRAQTVQVMFDYQRNVSKPLSEEQRRIILAFEADGAPLVR